MTVSLTAVRMVPPVKMVSTATNVCVLEDSLAITVRLPLLPLCTTPHLVCAWNMTARMGASVSNLQDLMSTSVNVHLVSAIYAMAFLNYMYHMNIQQLYYLRDYAFCI